MDSNKLTQMSRQAVTDAQALARRLSHNEVDTWHLLAALLSQENGIVPGLLEKLSITPSAVSLAVDRELERLPPAGRNSALERAAGGLEQYFARKARDCERALTRR